MTENEDCRRSGRDRRISTKLAAYYETENAFKKVKTPPSIEKSPKKAAKKEPTLTPSLKIAVAKPERPAKVTKSPASVLSVSAERPARAKKEPTSLLTVEAVKPSLPTLTIPDKPPVLEAEPAVTSTSVTENIVPNNTPLSLARPKREHRSSRRYIEAMESLSPVKKRQAAAKLHDVPPPQQIQLDTVASVSPSIVEYVDVLNENELISVDLNGPKAKKRKLSDSTRVSRNGVKIGRPSQKELQEYREFVIARGGDPDAPIPPKWRHEMLEAQNETPIPKRRKFPRKPASVVDAVESPEVQFVPTTATGTPRTVSDTRANLKIALDLPPYTPPSAQESRSPVAQVSTTSRVSARRGAPAKFVTYGQHRVGATQGMHVSPLVTNSTSVAMPGSKVSAQARPPPVIRFLKPSSTPSSILRATKTKAPAPINPEHNLAKPLNIEVNYPTPPPPCSSEEIHSFRGGYVTFPECAGESYRGFPRMYIPLEENTEYVLVNQNGELMCNDSPPELTPVDLCPPQKIHPIFEVQPDCTLTVL